MTAGRIVFAGMLVAYAIGVATGIMYAHATTLDEPTPVVSDGYDGTLLAGRVEVVTARLARASRARAVHQGEVHAHASFGAHLTSEAVRQRDVHREQVAAAEQARQAAAETLRRSAPPRPYNPVSGDVWWQLALCESGGRNVNTGNGYYGYFQFLPSTWSSVGGPGMPHHHDYATQRHYAQILQARSGWGQWPACSRKLGLR